MAFTGDFWRGIQMARSEWYCPYYCISHHANLEYRLLRNNAPVEEFFCLAALYCAGGGSKSNPCPSTSTHFYILDHSYLDHVTRTYWRKQATVLVVAPTHNVIVGQLARHVCDWNHYLGDLSGR